jgi:hypothetical protein
VNRPKKSARAGSKSVFQNSRVAAVFERYPVEVRKQLLRVRKLIFDTAASLEGVGPIEETLRWGEPSYLTTQSGTGTMVRINQLPRNERAFGIYFHCQTNLVETFRARYARLFEFEGNRALVFDVEDELPEAELKDCIAMALTYFWKRRSTAGRAKTTAAQRSR